MARTYASGDKIRCSPGAAATITGAVTLAVICQTAASRDAQWRALLSSLTAAGGHTQGYNIELNNSNKMVLGSDGGAFGAAPTTTTVAADGWCLHVSTKGAGTVAPQYNRYKYSTNVFVLGEAHGSTETNATAGGLLEIGGDFGGSSDFFVGDIAIAAMWDRVLSAAEIQNLPFTLQAWYASAPKGLWLLDQSAVAQLVADLTGGGANQSAITGTSVSTTAHVPVFNYTDGVWLPAGVAAAGGITITSPGASMTLGAATPTAAETIISTAGLVTLGAGTPKVTETVASTAGLVTLGAAAPALSWKTAPAAAALLTLGAGTPTVTVGGAAVTVTSPAALLTLSAAAPTATATVTSTAGLLTLGAANPGVVQTVTLASAARVSLTAATPIVIVTATLPAATVTLGVAVPTLKWALASTAGLLNLSAGAPVVTAGAVVVPGAVDLDHRPLWTATLDHRPLYTVTLTDRPLYSVGLADRLA